MYRTNSFRWWNIVAFAAVIAVNILSSTLPLGGRTIKQISDQYYIYITPASYAFMIWSLIYVLLAGFLIYQWRRDTGIRDSVRSIGIWFILSCIFNISWLILWHYLYIEWSVGMMLLLVLSVGVIYYKTRSIHYPTTGEKLFVKLPFSIYLGWVCSAFLVNIGIVIHKNGWSIFGLTEIGWSTALLCTGAVLAILISYPYRDYMLPLVFVWAYIAISTEHKDVDQILLSSFVLAAILFIYAIWLFFIRRK
ncbi:tryptophan-rich sensory protein [Paenibacillus faecalis]|uniref:tryptophan-rich sensory protein n=1 Tax=Paenibacillus faecalis TaxID=2079532 RepID=UPI000D10137B|nr:tryptophan-rich sensory protein [Paenibacillus faecalis]